MCTHVGVLLESIVRDVGVDTPWGSIGFPFVGTIDVVGTSRGGARLAVAGQETYLGRRRARRFGLRRWRRAQWRARGSNLGALPFESALL